MKMNVGLARKVGEASFGSRGASVAIELEADAALASDPPKLCEQIRRLYGLIRESLEEELHRRNGNNNGQPSPAGSLPPARPAPSAGNGAERNSETRGATRNQIKALFAITKQQKIDLHALLRARFNAYRADELSLAEASRLIDELKSETGVPRRDSA